MFKIISNRLYPFYLCRSFQIIFCLRIDIYNHYKNLSPSVYFNPFLVIISYLPENNVFIVDMIFIKHIIIHSYLQLIMDIILLIFHSNHFDTFIKHHMQYDVCKICTVVLVYRMRLWGHTFITIIWINMYSTYILKILFISHHTQLLTQQQYKIKNT